MLWERATANTTDTFVPMEKFMSGGGMLNLQPSTYLRLWEWREDKVNLIGATQAITVRIRYEKVLPLLTLGTDPVQIRSATDPLGFATAALAARSRGARALAQDLLGTAQMATENLIERYVRPEQTKGRRRMPYSLSLIHIWGCPIPPQRTSNLARSRRRRTIWLPPKQNSTVPWITMRIASRSMTIWPPSPFAARIFNTPKWNAG